MRPFLVPLVLSGAVATAAFAQSDNNPGPALGARTSTEINFNGTTSNGISGGQQAAPGALSVNSQLQVEGQLLDLYSLSRSGDLHLQTSAPGAVLPDAGRAPGTSSNMPVPDQPLRTEQTAVPHVGDSVGTYSRPAANAGSSDAAANIASAPHDPAPGTGGGIASVNSGSVITSNSSTVAPHSPVSPAGTGKVNNGNPPPGTTNPPVTAGNTVSPAIAANAVASTPPGASIDDQTRAHLDAGVPAAVVSGGRTYILACDPRQLSQFAGQTVRISGAGSGGVIVPERLEVRQNDGNFRSVAITSPDLKVRAANER